mgnify:CR=1 FL=1|tara:strand:- start:4622 stop:5167 length:546 start_codon:yes stop_codon:yes gene_type:complete
MKKTIGYKKIGILGGTFDPAHIGHLEISNYAIKKLKLSILFWAVTKKNPLKKKPLLSLKKRLVISKIQAKKNKKIKVKSFDNLINSSKTIRLIQYLKNKYSDSKIFFLMGSDNLIKFHKWDEWIKISSICKIAVFPRSKYYIKTLSCEATKTIGKQNILFMKSKKIDISSSIIRKNYLKYK